MERKARQMLVNHGISWDGGEWDFSVIQTVKAKKQVLGKLTFPVVATNCCYDFLGAFLKAQ